MSNYLSIQNQLVKISSKNDLESQIEKLSNELSRLKQYNFSVIEIIIIMTRINDALIKKYKYPQFASDKSNLAEFLNVSENILTRNILERIKIGVLIPNSNWSIEYCKYRILKHLRL